MRVDTRDYIGEQKRRDAFKKIFGGAAVVVLAGVWFFGALLLIDRIFFYPPILAIIGLVTIGKGLVDLATSRSR